MKKKYFKLFLIFAIGAILGIFLVGLFYSWALQKTILVSDQLNFVNNTGEIVLIIHDYNDGKVDHDYVNELLDRRINNIKQSKSFPYEVLSRGKSNSKYANYGAAIDRLVNSLEGLKDKVAKDEGIDTEKDMNDFIEAVENYMKVLQEVL
ncbi:hypothetical protein ACOMCU_15875 [Lysinibacillus sp. UGB7]|uniref:hypothetical protein n=1 Tax=Lysinibacillus sp. UGB7 TaxID=3411039 RepID=UPI003B774102